MKSFAQRRRQRTTIQKQYAKQIIVVIILVFLENIGAKQLASIAYVTGPNRYRKVGDK